MSKHVLPFLLMSTVLFTACTGLQTVKKMKSKTATVSEWRKADKTVLFIPMVHIAHPDFYRSVRRTIELKKADGFVVYYEGTEMKPVEAAKKQELSVKPYLKHFRGAAHLDSICQVVYKIKLSKFIGLIPDQSVYHNAIPETGFFSGMVVQPSATKLGMDTTDKNVDAGDNEMVDEYERRFGEIMLEEADFAMTASSTFPKSLRLPKNNVNAILIEYRDEYLARHIHHSADKKIIVLFGMVHMEGTFKQLKNLDRQWQRL